MKNDVIDIVSSQIGFENYRTFFIKIKNKKLLNEYKEIINNINKLKSNAICISQSDFCEKKYTEKYQKIGKQKIN